MAGIGDLLGGFNLGFGGSFVQLGTALIIGAMGISIIGTIMWYFLYKKKWNLKVEFNLPRAVKYSSNDTRAEIDNIQGSTEGEWGKGLYSMKDGTVWLKRKGKKKIPMKPFQVSKYLKSGNILTVVQIGAEEYLPVMPESYLIMEDDTTGEKVSVLDLKTDAAENKAWSVQFERNAKSTYSISSALSNLLSSPAFLIGLVIMLWGIQLLILYNRIK